MEFQELEITAQLAHLDVGKEQLTSLFPAFEQTIAFFDTMEDTETDPSFARAFSLTADIGKNSPPAASAFVGEADLRADTVTSDPALKELLLNNSGDRDGSFFVIPNVL
jgi:aspartyl-tRNA(Asn)/glutamyl-tRNA(Gln) amidotransferase subunit C